MAFTQVTTCHLYSQASCRRLLSVSPPKSAKESPLGPLVLMPANVLDFRRHVRPFFLEPLTGNPSQKKRYYDVATYLGTQLTFAFAVCPFLILTFTDSIRTWSNVYFYALVWTIAVLIFFASPGKAWLKKKLEARQGKANARLVRTISSDSITGNQPILGISKDIEGDINEAIEELKAEVEAQRKKD